MDPMCEKFYEVSPYAYCGGYPILRIDSKGRIWDTVWDVANVVYDVGAAIYNHVKGEHEAAKSHWCDAGADVVAAIIPCVPAGSSKLLRGGDKAVKTFQSNVKVGKDLKKQ